MKLHPEVQALSNALHDLEAFLRSQGQTHWAENVAQCVRSIDQSDAYGLRKFLTFFGGMGSLNDVVLVHDGVTLRAENEKLERLSAKAWKLADRLNREAK